MLVECSYRKHTEHVAAARMRITMTEWAKIGVPFGAVIMAVYFVLMYLVGV